MQTLSPNAGPSAPLGAERVTHRASWRRRVVGDALMGYAFIAPAVGLYLLFQGYPIVRGLTIAFSDYRFLIPDHQPFNGVDNWFEMWRDATFWASMTRSFQYTGLYVVGLLVFGLLGAVLIGSFQGQKEASVYRVIAYMPVVLPIAVALLLWRQLRHLAVGDVRCAAVASVGIRGRHLASLAGRSASVVLSFVETNRGKASRLGAH